MSSLQEIFAQHVKGNGLELAQQRSTDFNFFAEKLQEAGFTDFEFVNAGSSSIVISPTDQPNNRDIVFRITCENDRRRNDIPFFLASPWSCSQGRIKLELLLTGNPDVTPENKRLLLEEMKKVGWDIKLMSQVDVHNLEAGHFWNDVIMLSVRGLDGRIKTAPIISDPSALTFYFKENMWRGVPGGYNACGPDYITLQEQEAAYKSAIESDPRLQTLITEPFRFGETTILGENPQQPRFRG